MKRVIIPPLKASLVALFFASCISNSVMDEGRQSNTSDNSSYEEHTSDAVVNVTVEINPLYHKDFVFEGTPTVDVEALDGDVTRSGDSCFSLFAQSSSNCTVVISDINIPMSNTYGATTRCAVTAPAYMYGGEEYDVVITIDHTTLDDNGVALLPTPILFDAAISDWD